MEVRLSHDFTTRIKWIAVLLTATALTGFKANLAWAQVENGTPPPSRYLLDMNGVNLANGNWQDTLILGTIGSGDGALTVRAIGGNIERLGTTLSTSGDSWSAVVPDDQGGRTETFTKTGTAFTSTLGDGSTLTQSGSTYTLTTSDGTIYRYGYAGRGTSDLGSVVRLTEISYGDGRKLTLTYLSGSYCDNSLDSCQNGKIINKIRLQSVVNSFGYQLHYNYQSNTLDTPNKGNNWDRLISITLVNNAVDGCDPAAPTCNFTQTWPSVSGGWNGSGVTGTLGRTAVYGYDASTSTALITYPGASSANLRVTRDGNQRVASINNGGRTWQYSFAPSGSTMTAVVTNPDGSHRTVVSNIAVGLPTSVTDELGRATSYSYDGSGRLVSSTAPDGNQVQYTYDARGNVTQTTYLPKGGSGVASVSTSAGYDATCSNPVTCNSPVWTKDAKGNQTDYTYDATHGGLLTVTAAAAANGVRPQTRYSYTALQASYKDGSGTLISGTPRYLLTGTSLCRTQAACAGGVDETRTTITYGVAGTPNNLLPTTVTTASGDGSLVSTTTLAYDAIGNVTSVDGPLAGSDDTTRFEYDAGRQRTYAMGADPDGAGPMSPVATHYTYDGAGRLATTEVGMVPSQANDWSGFAAQQSSSTVYDDTGRKVTDSIAAGGTVFGVTQYGYDSVGRLQCTAVRMDPGQWTGQTDACVPQITGASGPDRVSRIEYDAAGQTTSVTNAYGTAEAATERTSYTPNGTLASVTDANGNRTSYTYDGLNRLVRTDYPSPATGADASNPGDYEQLTLDPNGNVVQRRLRDGQMLGYSYDALNRVTYADNPNTGVAEVDDNYGYDNLGRMTSAGDQNGWTNAWVYDALGRLVQQSSNVGGNTLHYDAGGRLDRETWGDGFYVTYEYDMTGKVTVVRENGGPVLATLGYDSLGRRTSVTRGNGTSTTYGYDAAGRLATLGQDLAGTSQDLSLGFSYNTAGQIATRTSSNDAYVWTGAVAVNRSYAVNGLNQYTGSGSVAPTYDGRGNLTSAGGQSYQYNTLNQLYGNGTGQLFYHGPAGYLGQTPGTDYDWVGDRLVTESNSSVQRRYVYVPGEEAPLVWYEGSGTGDRRYLHTDERGSVIAVTNDAGVATAINTYDEYGIPGSGNVGRFQYTGQKWIPELGMYDDKARMYSPTLGRFLQTDPIGYGDGLDWYNYVGGDPVNKVDLTGLTQYGFRTCTAGTGPSSTASNGDVAVGGVTCTQTYFDSPDFFRVPLRDRILVGDGGAKQQKDDNHGCAAGTTYKAMDSNGQPICQAPLPKFTRKWSQKQQHDDICKLLTLGGFATLPTSGAGQLNKLKLLGRLAPLVEDAAALSDPAAIFLGSMGALEGCY